TREEASLTSEVAAAIPGAVDLGGRTTLDSLGWILRRATLVVANDTGVAHLADALDVPSVVVFAADDGSRAARWAPLDTKLHQAVEGSPAAVSARARRLLRQIERGAGTRNRHPGVMA
ncbi:MAG TPA: glycosyltransferase family 9 protein, partial [Candidatus Limnocylindrales bacterium]|nr:glycosyltransferase family 9 protein [Candidatus Limnocylindrales bacterium]